MTHDYRYYLQRRVDYYDSLDPLTTSSVTRDLIFAANMALSNYDEFMAEHNQPPTDTQWRVIRHAIHMLHMWSQLCAEATVIPDESCRVWHKQAERQCYQDSLTSMKLVKLIEDYDVVNCRVRMGCVWYDAEQIPPDQKIVFVASGPEVDVTG